ncbi:hypothetical protein JCM14036_23320 [Desulfotomaculum defluvii]
MQVMITPNREMVSFQAQLEALINQNLCLVKHVLFPNCIYITSAKHNDEAEEDNFYLIFEIKKDRGGLIQAKIHFFQIPQSARNKKLGSKVYKLLEGYLQSLGCLSIELEAKVNTLDPKDNSVGFWGRQGFLPSVHYAFDDENFPMIKRFV